MSIILTADPREPDPSLLRQAVQCLRDGGIIIYPTETFYGLGVHYANDTALARLCRIKERDASKPVLLLIPDISWMPKLSCAISASALTLADHFWPGPLTLVLKASSHLSSFITGGSSTVGIRISSNTVAGRILTLFGDCITSTSANLSGEPSPSALQHISAQLIEAVDLVIDAGETPGGSPSTVLDLSTMPFTLIREGAISADTLRPFLKSPV
jgi:L-threonylcarbamoyladenylate synthase